MQSHLFSSKFHCPTISSHFLQLFFKEIPSKDHFLLSFVCFFWGELCVKGEHSSAFHCNPQHQICRQEIRMLGLARPCLFGPAGRRSRRSPDQLTQKSAAAWVVSISVSVSSHCRRRPGVWAPSVGVPDPGQQVSPRKRGPLEAAVFRRPGQVWGAVAPGRPGSPGRQPDSGACGWRVPAECRAHGLSWAPRMVAWSVVVGAAVSEPGPQNSSPRGRQTAWRGTVTDWALPSSRPRTRPVVEVPEGIRRENGPRTQDQASPGSGTAGLAGAAASGWLHLASKNCELHQPTLPSRRAGDAHSCPAFVCRVCVRIQSRYFCSECLGLGRCR